MEVNTESHIRLVLTFCYFLGRGSSARSGRGGVVFFWGSSGAEKSTAAPERSPIMHHLQPSPKASGFELGDSQENMRMIGAAMGAGSALMLLRIPIL